MTDKLYTTKAKIEAYLQETISADLSLYILSAQSFIDNYTQRNFKSTGFIEYEENETVRYFNGSGKRSLIIDPATFISNIETSSDEGLTFSEVTSFIAEPLNELPIVKLTLRDSYFPCGLMSVKITGMFGWGEEVPADISYVATVIASGMFKGKTIEEVTSEKIGDYSISYGDGKTRVDNVRSILDKYKKLV